MSLILESILAYVINLASGERSAAIAVSRERKLQDALDQEEALKKALASSRPIRDEVRLTCVELVRTRTRFGVTTQEEPLWRLLSEESFQADLAEWLMAGAIAEGFAAKDRLLRTMEFALSEAGANSEQIAFLKSGYFDALEKAVFASPILAHWRHQLSLDYLREQVAVLRQNAEEAAGLFSPEKQRAALDRYCEKALAAWDIIDLSNLPEGDIHMATQKLLLRQLYMPLRIEVEPTKQGEGDEAVLVRMEEEREARRHREAGHFLTDKPERTDRPRTRAPVGERLAVSRGLVVLGDPGGGKTTMLRWVATAYLLRHKGDAAFDQVPDTKTLPAKPWIPVLIRCRDLGEADLCRCFVDFLTQHLNKTELLPGEAEVMRAVILDRIAKGEALLLVDGLDEITNPRVRMMFCQELERTAARYPDAPIVVTSRIVGYRDMPYRMGSGFEHGQIAELNRGDKDLFASRWVEVTEEHQSTDEKAKRAQELLDALHSSDRIERLTGNPMLLTTLALVKRKVGKLPNKRTKLYAEAVSVLLNWNPRIFQIIEEDEAIPQLEYLAYEMCRRGVQRLADDEVLDLLDKLRVEYPNIRPIKRREPQAFLKHLEERSSILVKSGRIWEKDTKQEKPVWEFRHLAFQEYLAARALLDGRYPDRDKAKTLAEQVAPLASAVQKAKSRRSVRGQEDEVEIPESWRETLRLLVVDCKDDDVDDVLLALMKPGANENPAESSRPRTILAASCLADEPNVGEATAEGVLANFTSIIEGKDTNDRSQVVDSLIKSFATSLWSENLLKCLVAEYLRRSPQERGTIGTFVGRLAVHRHASSLDQNGWHQELLRHLKSGDSFDVLVAAFALMRLAFQGRAPSLPDFPKVLFSLLDRDAPLAMASAWALLWLQGGFQGSEERRTWSPSAIEIGFLVGRIEQTPYEEADIRRFLAKILVNWPTVACKGALEVLVVGLNSRDSLVRSSVVPALGQLGGKQAVAPLLAKVDDPDPKVRQAVIAALGQLGDKQAVVPLLARLDDQNTAVRLAVIAALGQLGDKQGVAPLLAKLDDPDPNVRQAVIAALGQLGDKQAVAPLLAKLDDPDPNVRQAVIAALGQLGDKQAVAPLLAKLDDPDPNVRQAVIAALGQLGDKQAVVPLLARLDDQYTAVRQAVIAALGKLGDKRAVAPLLAKLDDQNIAVRQAVIAALGKLGDKRAVAPLLAKLDDQNIAVRQAVITALGKLGDQQAVAPLLAKLDDQDGKNRLHVAAALHALGEPRGTAALRLCLASEDAETRRIAVGAHARQRDAFDRRLLSRDFDAAAPWLDSKETVTEDRVARALSRLNLKPEEVRSRYEAIAADLELKLSWKH